MRNLSTPKSKMEKERSASCSYLLIKNGVIIGSFPSFYQAFQQGLCRFGQREFLVKKSGEQ